MHFKRTSRLIATLLKLNEPEKSGILKKICECKQENMQTDEEREGESARVIAVISATFPQGIPVLDSCWMPGTA